MREDSNEEQTKTRDKRRRKNCKSRSSQSRESIEGDESIFGVEEIHCEA